MPAAPGLLTQPLAPVAPGPPPTWTALLGPAPLAQADRQQLHALARVRPVAAGQRVFRRGEPAPSLVALLQGEVALGLCRDHGPVQVDRVLHGPAWLDQGSAWLPGGVRLADAQARSAALVAELPADAMAQALLHSPALAARLVHSLARELQALAANTQALVHLAAPARLAQWLHAQCPAGSSLLRLPMRKRDLAAQLAVTPETLSRLMRSLQRMGVLEVAGYTVHIRDHQALQALAEG